MPTLELDMARNYLGPLAAPIRKRVEAVIRRPSQHTWDNAYSLILTVHGTKQTLWCAVLEVDPTFPASKPCDEPWPRIPSRDTILRALRWATH